MVPSLFFSRRASIDSEGKLRSMVPTEMIQNARRVLGSVRAIRLSEEPTIDVLDRLGLLTVVSGLRNAAAFGFAESNNGAAIEILSGILSSQGLCCLVIDASHSLQISV